MIISINVGKNPFDGRYCLVRFESNEYIYGEGFKCSVSIHPKFYSFERCHGSFHLTLFGINVHFRRA